MNGLENVKNKKLRFFKFDHLTEIKNVIHNKPESAFLVMGENLKEAFSISLDGSTKTPATIKAPRDDYLKYSPHALIKNELFIFGGWTDNRKVRKF